MDNDKDLPECRYGANCYRKNPEHLKKFSHPTDSENSDGKGYESDDEKTEDEPPVKRKRHGSDDDEKSDDSGEAKDKKSDESDADFVPPTASFDDRKNIIKQYFLFDMPDDFYAIWKFAETLKPKDPRNAFAEFGLVLCGPYDVLAGAFGDVEKVGADEFLLHCRYYYDVPEFQTVIRQKADDDGTESLFHIGYLRDEPTNEAIVCSNDGENCKLTILGDNLFAAIVDFAKSKDAPEKTVKRIADEAEKGGFPWMAKNCPNVNKRRKNVVAKTFHGAGIVVPMEGDVGYRPLGTSDDQLKKTLQHFDEKRQSEPGGKQMRDSALSKLQELMTYIQFANDECDFGMGYELGVDLFCSGYADLHPYVDQLLSVAYKLLKREQFKTILSAHLTKRRRGKPFSAAT